MRSWLPHDSKSVSYPGALVTKTLDFSVIQQYLPIARHAPGPRLQVLKIKKTTDHLGGVSLMRELHSSGKA